MPDANTSPRAARQAPRHRQGTAVQRQGLALRFTLIIGDSRLAGVLQVVCHQDAVTVEFPETSIRIGLSRLSSEENGGVVLHCRASYRSGGLGPRETTRVWQRALSGRSGALHQREALLREILAARSRAPGRVVARPNPASLRFLAAAV
ncbi:hypothetical protein [Streptomyces sp. GS7]|uniref:hypothetical protein n=1 Tax=Streptomyces sp. GS7 TaxID=2692234 RepID=UPI001316DCCF|nr:hypothetical protein [Streptomyces sp. GS7]QHC24589.1 hypothetical protein GR130_27695 [Streptomyces sp. GS7]